MLDNAPLSLAIVFALMGMSAFFSSSEAAFLSVQRTRIAHMINEGVPGAKTVSNMIGNPERLLSTILLGNNLVNVAFTSVITVAMVAVVGSENQGLGVLLATLVGTTALLIFGEIIPKSIAVRKSERVALLYRYPLLAVEHALILLVMPLQWITSGVNALVGAPDDGQSSIITENEFRALIDIGEEEGRFETAEADRLERVFQFGDRQVVGVMTPRTEMVSIQEKASLGDFLEKYSERAHSRFPLYRDSPEDIIGVLSSKDVLRQMAERRDLNYDDALTADIRPARFVPETKPVSELFHEMRLEGNQMALVIDEFGGVTGLVTLKRLLEVIVGDVGEEGDSPEYEYQEIDKNTFVFEGGMSIAEVNQQTSMELPEGDYETIAGFALYKLGKIPEQGDHFEHDDMTMEITRMDGLKIEEIRAASSKPKEDADKADEDGANGA